MVVEGDMSWRYEPDERPKVKHRWKNDYAGFIEKSGVPIGKCPASITEEQAEGLLREAEPWTPRGWRHPYPKRLYNVLGGIPYRATPTNPGTSYHGFPEKPSELLKAKFRHIRRELRSRAKAEGTVNVFEHWLKTSADLRGEDD
jgi:hypothetical protein